MKRTHHTQTQKKKRKFARNAWHGMNRKQNNKINIIHLFYRLRTHSCVIVTADNMNMVDNDYIRHCERTERH